MFSSFQDFLDETKNTYFDTFIQGGGFSSYDVHELRRLNYLWRNNIESLDREDKRKSYDCHDILQQLNSTNTAVRLALPNTTKESCREEGFDVIINTLSVSDFMLCSTIYILAKVLIWIRLCSPVG